MCLALNEDALSYESFNHFFTRALKPEARPIDNKINSIASPVDGVISQIGLIDTNNILQAKGRNYTLEQLLAGQEKWCHVFRDGSFATIYLSPKDYHRIHMPCAGTLKQMTYVPGKLFSVSPLTTRVIPGVFARNERALCFFETEFGSVAVILVGAMIVGGMETVWKGAVTPPHGDRIAHWHYTDEDTPKTFQKGDEMGRFNLGSTVILLFEKNRIQWENSLNSESEVTVGKLIAEK